MFAIEPGRDYAVVTGDVIDSSSLEATQRRRLPELIHEISQSLTEWFGEQRLTPVSIFGGDSWRILLATPADALRVALFLRASLLASDLNIDSRLAIAVAGVDFVPHGVDIEAADGEAFRLSGRLLDEDNRTAGEIRFGAAQSDLTTRWRLPLRLLDALVRSTWNEKRAAAVCGALRGWTRQHTGETWSPPVSRQTIDRHLSEACWPEVEGTLKEFEQALSDRMSAQ
ncbi:hypothetical protein [Botrimarina sp.]|uniref:hypothetical protein n=1 Tax=Botrimarina sp. TaxID=2795802 RepID=UPI0032EB5612